MLRSAVSFPMLSEADAIEGEIMDTVPKEMEPENDGPIDASDVDVGEEEEEKPAPTIAGGLFQWASVSYFALESCADDLTFCDMLICRNQQQRHLLPYLKRRRRLTTPSLFKIQGNRPQKL